MGEDLSTPTITGLEQREYYPGSRYTFLLIVMAALLLSVIILHTPGKREVKATSGQEDSLIADLDMKFYFATSKLAQMAATAAPSGQKSRIQSEQFRREAVSKYRKIAACNPTEGNISRLILIEEPDKRPQVIQRLAKLESGKRSTGHVTAGAMWNVLYETSYKIPAQKTAEYAATIRKLKLGWYRHLALAKLYDRAGDVRRADAERYAANRIASWTFVLMMTMGVLFLLFSLLGIVLGTVYIVRKKAGFPSAPTEISSLDPVARSLAAGYLLEIFVAYLLVYLFTAVSLPKILVPILRSSAERSPAVLIGLEISVYVLWGTISLIYLCYRLRRAGWSLKLIGFTSHSPMGDIMWGIGGYAVALPLLVIVGIVSRLIEKYTSTPPNPIVPLFMESNSLLERLLLLLLASVAAPFFEEIFFRGVLFRSFATRWRAVVGIVLSAMVFALVHPLPLGFLPIFVLGTIFAVIANQRGSLLPGMVAHALNNTLAFVLLFILSAS